MGSLRQTRFWARLVPFKGPPGVSSSRDRRLFGPIGNIPPAEFEALYDGSQEAPAMAAGLN